MSYLFRKNYYNFKITTINTYTHYNIWNFTDMEELLVKSNTANYNPSLTQVNSSLRHLKKTDFVSDEKFFSLSIFNSFMTKVPII